MHMFVYLNFCTINFLFSHYFVRIIISILFPICSNEVINYDNVHVSYQQLATLRRSNKVSVDKFVINALCRKLFNDKHPKDSRRHFFFSTVGVSASSPNILFHSFFLVLCNFKSFFYILWSCVHVYFQDFLMKNEWNHSFLYDTCMKCFNLANGCFKFESSDYVSNVFTLRSLLCYSMIFFSSIIFLNPYFSNHACSFCSLFSTTITSSCLLLLYKMVTLFSLTHSLVRMNYTNRMSGALL